MMMFAGAALTAFDFVTGLASDAIKSASQKAGAAASSTAASAFSLTDTASSSSANATGTSSSITSTGSTLSANTLQTLLALQQDFKQASSSSDPLSLLDSDRDGSATPRNAILQEAERRLQQAQLLATTTQGQAVTLNV